MGCISSVPHEKHSQPNIDNKKHNKINEDVNNIAIKNDNTTIVNNIAIKNDNSVIENNNIAIHNDNDNYHPVNSNFESNQIISKEQHDKLIQLLYNDKKTISFIEKYKLESLSLSIYNEGITVDFLLSQNTNDILLIANKLIDNNIIQQKKFIYAVTTEKKFIKNKLANSNQPQNVSKTEFANVHEMKEINENGTFIVYITNPYNDQDSLPLSVCCTDNISNVLSAFQKKYNKAFLNLPKLHKTSDDITQMLTYCGTEMLHNKDLAYYKVIPESELYLTIRCSQINRRGKRTKSHTNSKVKPKSKNKSKSKSHSYTCTNTCSNSYINYNNNKEGFVLGCEEKINIYINHKKCLFALQLGKQTKIKKLKHKIEKKLGIGVKNQRLNYNGMELSDFKRINYYSIEDNCNIYLTKKMGLYSVDISVCYKDKLVSMDFDKYDTIKCIKIQIQLYLNIAFDKQRLIYLNEELLNDDATIKSVNICDGVVLHLQSD